MIKLAVLISGSGSNLQAIIDNIENGNLNASISLVLSNKKKAFGLERARKHNIKDVFVSPKEHETREQYDLAVVKILKEHDVDLIVLAGYMRILSESFVKEFKGKIINIHPALLPKYPGIHSIERAFEAKDKMTGVTVHFVDEGVDTGPIIKQIEIPIEDGDTLEVLEERVHKAEHKIYPEVIKLFCEGKIKIEGRKVIIC